MEDLEAEAFLADKAHDTRIVPGVNERGDIQRTDGLARAKTLGHSL
ncbi:hypothetical protein [Treponema endosymbiont of Eucomonympha sp.]|nr:hypothetical protein [Treponema endosymbiont of Eucomonympha sp.]